MTANEMSFKLLLLDADGEASALYSLLRSNHPEKDLSLALDVEKAELLLKKSVFEALLIKGKSSQLKDIVSTVASFAQHFDSLVLVAAVPAEDKSLVMPLIKAGAHGVLLLPASGEELRKTFRIAFRRAQDLGDAQDPAREQITNFTWLLEHVAARLDSLASRLREEEKASGKPVNASPRRIKEALLGALGSTANDELFCEEFADWIAEKTAKADEEDQTEE